MTIYDQLYHRKRMSQLNKHFMKVIKVNMSMLQIPYLNNFVGKNLICHLHLIPQATCGIIMGTHARTSSQSQQSQKRPNNSRFLNFKHSRTQHLMFVKLQFKDEPSTSSSNQAKSKRDLASMFRPPIELIFQGDWDMVFLHDIIISL